MDEDQSLHNAACTEDHSVHDKQFNLIYVKFDVMITQWEVCSFAGFSVTSNSPVKPILVIKARFF